MLHVWGGGSNTNTSSGGNNTSRNNNNNTRGSNCRYVDSKDERTGNTALHLACANGKLDCARLLIMKMALGDNDDVVVSVDNDDDSGNSGGGGNGGGGGGGASFLPNLSGNTPLHYAASNGRLDIVKELVDSYPPTITVDVDVDIDTGTNDDRYDGTAATDDDDADATVRINSNSYNRGRIDVLLKNGTYYILDTILYYLKKCYSIFSPSFSPFQNYISNIYITFCKHLNHSIYTFFIKY